MEGQPTDSHPKTAARAYLETLERTGRFLFHGSGQDGLAVLEPCPVRHPAPRPPCSCAVAGPRVEPAVFRALFHADPAAAVAEEGGRARYRAARAALEAARFAVGYVYVFDHAAFSPCGSGAPGGDWRLAGTAAVIEAVRVTADDLPGGIETVP